MKHGFLISSYKNVQNIDELIKYIDTADSFFFIHVDKKIPAFDDPIIQNLRKKSNVVLLNNRVTVNWGGFSHLEAIISLVKEGLKNKDIAYFHLLSDSCFTIKPHDAFFNFFNLNNGKEFIEFVKLPASNWAGGGLNRLHYYHMHDLINIKGKLNRRIEEYFVYLQKVIKIKRNIHAGFESYYGGGTYWSLSRDFLNYAVEYLTNHPSFYSIFKHSFCAEEIFFHTILLNSSFKSNVVNDNLR